MDLKSQFFKKHSSLNLRGEIFSLEEPVVMGILNITPDSFYADSRVQQIDKAIEKCALMLKDGANVIDIGAYSSRPGAQDIDEYTELKRLSEFLKPLRENFKNAIFSLDTFRGKIASHCAEKFGINIINDISGGSIDSNLIEVVAALKLPYVLMHMKGTPQDMVNKADYNDLKRELFLFFAEKIDFLNRKGVSDLIIDPGFGFGKNINHNFQILSFLEDFKIFELPIMIGISRKSMIYKTLGYEPEQALNGSTVLHTIALQKGVDILRVHDVREAREVIKLTQMVNQVSKNC